MELDNKTSYLLLFTALLLVRSGRASPATALRVMPLSGRSRRLAELIATGRRNPPYARPEQVEQNAQEQANGAGENRPMASERGDLVQPHFGNQYVSAPGVAA
ncbi:MAG: hypothetical protein HYX73_03930 [Acidobacteria bacterium]|nr:hypothetical protein [Acidobacteriota bacterium]